MSRDWQSYLADMRTACEKISLFTAGMDRDAFFGDDRTYHAYVVAFVMWSHALVVRGS